MLEFYGNKIQALNKQALREYSGIEIWDPPQGALIFPKSIPKHLQPSKIQSYAFAPLWAFISLPMPEFNFKS